MPQGYHLGEHKMPFGKGEPYDTDVRLPMYGACDAQYTTLSRLAHLMIDRPSADSFSPACSLA